MAELERSLEAGQLLFGPARRSGRRNPEDKSSELVNTTVIDKLIQAAALRDATDGDIVDREQRLEKVAAQAEVDLQTLPLTGAERQSIDQAWQAGVVSAAARRVPATAPIPVAPAVAPTTSFSALVTAPAQRQRWRPWRKGSKFRPGGAIAVLIWMAMTAMAVLIWTNPPRSIPALNAWMTAAVVMAIIGGSIYFVTLIVIARSAAWWHDSQFGRTAKISTGLIAIATAAWLANWIVIGCLVDPHQLSRAERAVIGRTLNQAEAHAVSYQESHHHPVTNAVELGPLKAPHQQVKLQAATATSPLRIVVSYQQGSISRTEMRDIPITH